MKTIAVTVQLPLSALVEQLAPEVARVVDDRPRPKGPPAQRMTITRVDLGSSEVEQAIKAVVYATDRLDADQHTRGEHGAAVALFEAAKQLRTAVKRKGNLK